MSTSIGGGSRRPVAYLDELLPRAEDQAFLHLGHWDDPRRADLDLRAAQQRYNDRLLLRARLTDGLRVLDVGCGLGGTLAGLAERYPAMKLMGIDIEGRQIDCAGRRLAARGHDRVELAVADACALPCGDHCFDRVLAFEAAFHFDSRRRFLMEARRVLKPGGLLVLSDILPGARLAELEHEPGPALAVESVIQAGMGPWPDFWGCEPNTVHVAKGLGFRMSFRFDATRVTLPSYRCMLGESPPQLGSAATASPLQRALAVMAWLQANEMLQILYLAFELG